MQEFRMLKDSAAIKALAHPLRLRLLEHLIAAPASVQQLAEQLAEVHAKLFYHVKELEKQGLVEVVGEQVKNGIIEKYYRATARTFFLGQTVGPFGQVETVAERAVMTDILRQRQEQLLQIDNRAVARELVHHSLKVRPGAKLIVEGASHQTALMEALLMECRLVGAEAFIRLMDPKQILQLLTELSPAQLAQSPPLTTALYGSVDLWISLDSVPDSRVFAEFDQEKVQALVAGELSAYRDGPKRFAAIQVGYPSAERAGELGIDYTVLHDLFWQSMSVPVSVLQQIGADWVARLQVGSHLQLEQAGRALRIAIDSSQPFGINDGTLSQDQVRSNNFVDLNLPGGQITFRPQVDQTCGTLMIGKCLHRGQLVQNLQLCFDQGQLISWQAEQGEATCAQLLGLLGAEPTLGQVSIGFNPKAGFLTGYKALDPVTQGAVGLQLIPANQTVSDISLPLWFYAKDVSIS